MKQCNILLQVLLGTSKAKLDFQYNNLCIGVSSVFAKRLNTQNPRTLGNIRQISMLVGSKAQCLVSLPEIRIWSQQLKITEKQISNVLDSRSNHSNVFCEIGVLSNFAKFTGKHLCQSTSGGYFPFCFFPIAVLPILFDFSTLTH